MLLYFKVKYFKILKLRIYLVCSIIFFSKFIESTRFNKYLFSKIVLGFFHPNINKIINKNIFD